jgi:D-3-phosphoglycerate dehydrogenase
VACPLTPDTTGLINSHRLGLMKPTSVLINVARGPVVDEDALFAALRDKVIHGAAIDVWYRCVLALAHHNLLYITPHVVETPMLIMFVHGHGLLDSA